MTTNTPAPADRMDHFRGDNAHLIRSIDALLDLDDARALVPHGLGGKEAHAYVLLNSARHRITVGQGKRDIWLFVFAVFIFVMGMCFGAGIEA